MENFQELNPPINPQRTSGEIISHAFEMYKGVFLYAILAMVISIVASIFLQSVLGFNTSLMSDEIRSADGDFSAVDFSNIPGLRMYYASSGLLGILVTPLFVGIIYLANQYNFRDRIDFADLFIGYKQNFVNILIYGLISQIILAVAFAMCILPGLLILPFLLLGYPILLFENASFSEAISKSFKLGKENYGIFLGASLLGLLISISGILLCGVGLIATMPFYLIVTYSAYCAVCGRPRPLVTRQ